MATSNFTRLFSNSGLLSTCMKSTTLALLFVLVGCGGHPSHTCTDCSGVVFFGDSIFGEWNLEEHFPGAGYVNGGMFGYRTDQLKAILPAVLSGEQVCHGLAGNDTYPLTCVSGLPTPKTIIIMAGWNNFFQGDPKTALSDLQAMASTANEKGVRVIICTLYAYDPAHPAPWMQPQGKAPVTFYDMWRDPLNSGIHAIPNVTIVDFSALMSGQSGYTQDGVHPTGAAYDQMTAVISGVI
jgi:hypothetical protein